MGNRRRVIVKKEIIRDVTQLIEIVAKQVKCISESNEEEMLLFRGQNVDAPLLPKNARKLVADKRYNLKETHPLHIIEANMLDEFKRRSRPLLVQQVMPESDWDWLTLAQHHGMETRLLDWTENPLVALSFALESNSNSNGMIIWILKIKKTDIIIPSKTVNQAGWFSIHKYFEKYDNFLPLENIPRFNKHMTKINVLGDITTMKRNLNLYGINPSTLFPDLDGLCKYVNLKRELDNRYNFRTPQAIKNKNI
jgi:hypothetical protein